MDNLNISGNYTLNFNALKNIYSFTVKLLENGKITRLEKIISDLHLNYNHVNPYSIRVLIGEIAVKIPNQLINQYAEYIYKKFNISIHNLELYIENRIKMIILQDAISWKNNVNLMFTRQAEDLFNKSLILDKKYQNKKSQYDNVINWPKTVMFG